MFSSELDKMGPEPQPDAASGSKPSKTWGSTLWSKSVKSLREIVRVKEEDSSSSLQSRRKSQQPNQPNAVCALHSSCFQLCP